MCFFRTIRTSIEHLPDHPRTDRTRLSSDPLRDLQRRGQHILPFITKLREQAIVRRGVRREDVPRNGDLQCTTVTDQTWQKVTRTRLRDQTTLGEDESDLRFRPRDPQRHGECQGDSDPHRVTVDGGDGRFRASVNRQRSTTATIAVITRGFVFAIARQFEACPG